MQKLNDAKEGVFDEVLVWKINRIARKNIDLLQIVDILNKKNV
jgi:site-specific DNA recombinase